MYLLQLCPDVTLKLCHTCGSNRVELSVSYKLIVVCVGTVEGKTDQLKHQLNIIWQTSKPLGGLVNVLLYYPDSPAV